MTVRDRDLRLVATAMLVTTLGARGTLWIAGGVSALAGLVGVLTLSASRAQARAALDESL